MKILYTAFNGQDNSSKILLDKIIADNTDKLYLRNSFETSVKQLINKLKKYESMLEDVRKSILNFKNNLE